MADMLQTYWNSNGKYQVAAEELQILIPFEGKCKNRFLELFRLSVNMYHDIYNNGGYNWKIRGASTLKKIETALLEKFNKVDVCSNYNENSTQQQIDCLENIMDRIILMAVAEQNLTSTLKGAK